jgi:hypothetical protein
LPGGGLSSPAEPLAFSFDKAPEKVVNMVAEAVRDKIADED